MLFRDLDDGNFFLPFAMTGACTLQLSLVLVACSSVRSRSNMHPKSFFVRNRSDYRSSEYSPASVRIRERDIFAGASQFAELLSPTEA